MMSSTMTYTSGCGWLFLLILLGASGFNFNIILIRLINFDTRNGMSDHVHVHLQWGIINEDLIEYR